MAILTKGIFGPISGRLGNLVFCICVDGTNYVRTRPNKTKKAPTMAQLAQREKFRVAMKFLSPLKTVLRKGFHKEIKKNASPMGVAMSAMLRSGIIGEYPDFRIDFPRIQLSTGNLQPLSALEVKRLNSNMIMLNWISLSNRFNSFLDDAVLVIIYNVTQGEFVIEEGRRREDEVLIVRMETAKPKDRLVFYAFMETKTGNTCAQYAGECVF